jgi:hypothetical protein
VAIDAMPDRRAYQLELLIQALWPGSRSGVEPFADPFSAALLHRLDLSHTPRILYGRVIEGIAYTHGYRVQVENGMSTIPCTSLVHTSLSALGARQLNTYSPGTGVYILYSPDVSFGIILGADPDYMVDATQALSDFISQGSNVGLGADIIHKIPFSLAAGSGLGDWSAGRPADSLPIGEWGAITETGLRFFLDSFLLGMAVDEETGVWGFYADQLLRIAGHNLQLRSSGVDHEYLDDESEYHHVERHGVYPWESMGCDSKTTQSYVEWSADDTQQKYPWLGRYEPFHDDQQAMHRLETYYGFLGSAYKRYLHLMPRTPLGEPLRMGDQIRFPGVFEESLLLTGQYMIRSAKAVIIAKDMKIPVPKQLRRPEDPEGDTATNYVPPAGQIITDGPAYTGPAATAFLIRSAALLDTLAYTFNYEGVVPFLYHLRDWYTPEQSASPDAADAAPDFHELTNNQLLSPEAVFWRVDDRYTDVTYYRNGSALVLHDDGTVSLTGAFGEQLLMCGGSIWLDAPGDVWVRSGRNFNVWSGYDAVVKANNSVDLTCSHGDLRAKADRNMQFLAGLKGDGGVLIESKADCPYHEYRGLYGEEVVSSGVVLRADTSQVVAISRDMVLTNNCPSVTYPGNMVLDFGDQKVVARGALFERHLEAAIDFFGNEAVNEWWASGALVGTGLSVRGPMRVDGGYLSVDGWIYASQHVASKQAQAYNFAVGKEGDDTSAALDSEFAALSTRYAELDLYREEALHDLDFRDGMCDARFSFRTPAQYFTSNGQLAVHEARWQQMARLVGTVLGTWDEPTLTIDGTPLQPFPGFEEWAVNANYYQEGLGLYNVAAGQCVNRGPAYTDDPNYQQPDTMPLQVNYRTVRSL